MQQKNTIIKGATYLGVSTFIAKLLGAIYRVPLTNLLGSYGLGIYQMVFPLYSLLLDFSGAGVPSALSRLISKSTDKQAKANQYLNVALRLFFVFGLVATGVMACFSGVIAKLQGDLNARLAYLYLSPAILLVSFISCFRGYFQGFMDMKPTAFSQIIEQVVKLILGVVLVSLFMPNIEIAVAGATLAISISEVVALVYLFIKYKANKNKSGLTFSYQQQRFFQDSKTIIKTTFPITLVGIMIPFSQVIDSFLTINILGRYLDNATSLYGLLSGVVMTVINLPVSICYGLAVVAIPSLSSSKTQTETNKKGLKIILLTIAFSLPALIFLVIFAPFSINLLYRGLNQGEKVVAISLLRFTSPCVVLLSLVQATNAILIGRGKLYTPVITLLFGVVIKTVLNILLLSNVNMNIYGGAIAIIACYFFVCLVNLILLRTKGTKNENKSTFNCQY